MKILLLTVLISSFLPQMVFGKSCISVINKKLFVEAANRIGAEKTKNLAKLARSQMAFSELLYIKHLIQEIQVDEPGPLREELYQKFSGKKNPNQIDQILKRFTDEELFCLPDEDKKGVSVLSPDELFSLIEQIQF